MQRGHAPTRHTRMRPGLRPLHHASPACWRRPRSVVARRQDQSRHKSGRAACGRCPAPRTRWIAARAGRLAQSRQSMIRSSSPNIAVDRAATAAPASARYRSAAPRRPQRPRTSGAHGRARAAQPVQFGRKQQRPTPARRPAAPCARPSAAGRFGRPPSRRGNRALIRAPSPAGRAAPAAPPARPSRSGQPRRQRPRPANGPTRRSGPSGSAAARSATASSSVSAAAAAAAMARQVGHDHRMPGARQPSRQVAPAAALVVKPVQQHDRRAVAAPRRQTPHRDRPVGHCSAARCPAAPRTSVAADPATPPRCPRSRQRQPRLRAPDGARAGWRGAASRLARASASGDSAAAGAERDAGAGAGRRLPRRALAPRPRQSAGPAPPSRPVPPVARAARRPAGRAPRPRSCRSPPPAAHRRAGTPRPAPSASR